MYTSSGVKPVKIYPSVVPHENSTLIKSPLGFRSCVVDVFLAVHYFFVSYLLQSAIRLRHFVARNTILKWTISRWSQQPNLKIWPSILAGKNQDLEPILTNGSFVRAVGELLRKGIRLGHAMLADSWESLKLRQFSLRFMENITGITPSRTATNMTELEPKMPVKRHKIKI